MRQTRIEGRDMKKYSIAVIGGGAAGICAAIAGGRRGESVVICEKMPRLGKKILASGDGRCNLLNDNLDEAGYNPAARNLVRSVFSRFAKGEILDFFKGLGLEVYSKEGRIFPITNQAASVLKVLEMELGRLSIAVEYNFDCSGLSFSEGDIIVSAKSGQKLECRKVILAGGGRTYPAYGSDGSMYDLARSVGHSIIAPVPAAVPLVSKDNLCQALQGQRIFATAKSIVDGVEYNQAEGELLFTKYGLSGTCILDISETISIALNRQHKTEVFVSIDMVPFMEKELLQTELARRARRKLPAEEMLVGILPNKLSAAFKNLFGESDINAVLRALKSHLFKISTTRGWNEAEFTCGGINVDEVKMGTLESKLKENVYFAGEILDVNGKRGGYNLGWAWASGWIAGQTGS